MKRVLKWVGIVLASLIVLPVLTLIVMGHRANAGKTHASTEIAATPEQLFVWLDEGARLKQWVSWLVEVREPDPQQHTIGSSRTWVMKDENNGGMLMTLAGRLTEYEPPRRMVISIDSTLYQFEGRESYTLTALGNGRTRLDADGEYTYHQWLANLMEPLISPAAEKKMKADLAHLKSLVEAKAELR